MLLRCYTQVMKGLLPSTRKILALVEDRTGVPIEFMRDDSMDLLATLQLARHGASFHVLRYKPSDTPIDYFVAFQAGFALRLVDNPPDQRFDFSPSPSADEQAYVLLTAAQGLNTSDREAAPALAKSVAQWALLTLRSLPVGMRIDQWIALEYPELRDLQSAGIAVQQQQNVGVMSFSLGHLTIPTNLLGMLAAYAFFADELAGGRRYAIPFEATGSSDLGRELFRTWNEMPAEPQRDCELVDAWASLLGMRDWYSWISFIR
jgi:hypothetical protein